MQPNANNQTPVPEQPINPTPTQPPTPAGTPQQAIQTPAPSPQQPQPVFSQAAAPAPAPQFAPQKNNTTLWIIIGAAVAIGILLAILFFVVGPLQKRAKAYDTADKFYRYSQDDNSSKLATLYEDTSAKDFIDQAAEKVNKSCNIDKKSYKEVSESPLTVEVKGACTEGVKDWTFELTYDDKNRAWLITKIVYNNRQATTVETDTPAPSNTPAKSEGLACLTANDASHFTSVLPTNVFGYYYSDNFFFNADSTSYQYPDQANGQLVKFADFYKKNSNKAFTYNVKGSVNEGAQTDAGKALADQRAGLIKNELGKLGVPANRVVVDAPVSVTNRYVTEASRNVTISVTADRNCSDSGSVDTGSMGR